MILYYDGRKWEILYDDAHLSVGRYAARSVWTSNGKRLYVVGVTGLRIYDVSKKVFASTTNPAVFMMYDIEAMSVADMFTSGVGEVVHYNGRTWYLYPEIQSIGEGFGLWYTIKATGDFVLIGGGYYMGYNTAPIVLRGYR